MRSGAEGVGGGGGGIGAHRLDDAALGVYAQDLLGVAGREEDLPAGREDPAGVELAAARQVGAGAVEEERGEGELVG